MERVLMPRRMHTPAESLAREQAGPAAGTVPLERRCAKCSKEVPRGKYQIIAEKIYCTECAPE